jgi:hypothetical protein
MNEKHQSERELHMQQQHQPERVSDDVYFIATAKKGLQSRKRVSLNGDAILEVCDAHERQRFATQEHNRHRC